MCLPCVKPLPRLCSRAFLAPMHHATARALPVQYSGCATRVLTHAAVPPRSTMSCVSPLVLTSRQLTCVLRAVALLPMQWHMHLCP